MVKYKKQDSQLDSIFQSLSDSTRRDILQQVAMRELSVMEIAKAYAMSLPAISKHLNVLERAQLIERSKKGRTIFIRLQPQTLQKVSEYLEFYAKFWTTQIDQLEQFLQRKERKK